MIRMRVRGGLGRRVREQVRANIIVRQIKYIMKYFIICQSLFGGLGNVFTGVTLEKKERVRVRVKVRKGRG
jgi:hypothetical protein